MAGLSFEPIVMVLFCGTLAAGWIVFSFNTSVRRSRVGDYFGFAPLGSSVGFMVGVMLIPVLYDIVFSWLQGSSFQFRQMLNDVFPVLWLAGGTATGGLVGILLVQWSRRDRK